ncbi:hypothetical protein Q4489_02685 [Thalassotalea sp. 1_MG-2023]|uniref:hypothetical protein n=1 Tax=Thalassotalea sp. 1_MG-2023 TaxID=3062680 RepID=UPI0026E40A7F|nr:hypothetical protein [Thalassotalea sp. 1_MG-2023]MDO6425897.1 hypothetical protein [Thalassotalea sp. 1_MG-2023]
MVTLVVFMVPIAAQTKAVTALQCQQYKLTEWQRICPQNAFCFRCPASFQAQKVIAIDSLSGTLEEKQWVLQYDVGQYINDYSHVEVIKRRPYSIAAGEGELIIMTEKIAFIIDDILPSAPLLLEMSHKQLLTAKGKLDVPLAKCIFSTITKT